jgi:glucose/arabinose dehydrogenase
MTLSHGSRRAFYAFLLSALPAAAQTFTYPGCSNLAATEFANTELAVNKGLQEPVAFDLQGEWNAAGDSVTQVNIFFAERLGKVKFYNGATQQVTLAGTLPVMTATPSLVCCNGADDNGLMGIAVDPDYKVNRWIYVWYGPPEANKQVNPRLRLSRFTITAQNTLDMGSEKILIDILTSKGEHRHAGGPMAFDAHGDLWVTLGQSGNDINYPTANSQWSADSGQNQEWGPSNTASLRGGIFRIHPDDKATAQRKEASGSYGPGYTVPAGNFGEYWAGQFQAQKPDLATQYRNPSKVLPEVYIKGNRSPHSIGVHPTRRWLAWGEVNPPNNADEINLFAHPVFAGMPYFYGNNTVVTYPGKTIDPQKPVNNSTFNNGVAELPPAMPGTMVGGTQVGNVAIAGPFYVYNRALKNRNKLPPHLDNHFFHMSFQANRLWVNAVDTATAQITATTRIDNSLMPVPLRSPLAARIGPDGALYVLNYDGYYTTIRPAVERMHYTGSCFLAPLPSPVAERPPDRGLAWSASGFSAPGDHAFYLHDLDGRLLLEREVRGPARHAFADLRARHGLRGGVGILRVRTVSGAYSRKIVY